MLKRLFNFIVPLYLMVSDWRAKKLGLPPFDKLHKPLPIKFDFVFKNAHIPEPCSMTLAKALGEVYEGDLPEHGPYPEHIIGNIRRTRYSKVHTIEMDDEEVDLDKIMRLVHKETNNPSEYVPPHMDGFAIPDGIDVFVNGVKITWVIPDQRNRN